MPDLPRPASKPLDPAALTRRWYPDLEIRAVRRLEGGWMNDVFAIESDLGTFVLRILQPEATEPMTAWSHAFLDRIAPQLTTVQPPLRTPAGSSYVLLPPARSEAPSTIDEGDAEGRRIATLERFIEGRLGQRDTGADRAPAARALGTLHTAIVEATTTTRFASRPGYPAFVDLDWRENRWWSWSSIDRALITSRVDITPIERALEEIPALLRSVDPTPLPTHPIHADYHEENLLLTEGVPDPEVVAIIDWDETRLDWRVWDIANALWSLCRNDTNTALIPAASAAFLETYESTGPAILDAERALIPLCTRSTRLFEALWGLGEMQRGHAGWHYLEQNIHAISALPDLELG